MAKVDFQPQRPHELLAVYPDEETAQRVLLDLREKASEWTAAHGDNKDEQISLNAEMAEEIRESWVQPQAAIIAPKESAKTSLWMFPLTTLASAVVAFPLSFLWSGEMSAGARLVLAIFMAVMIGGTITLVLMALGQKSPSEPMAAERGVIVRVHDDREELRRLMLDAKPLRLDVIDDRGRPIETLATAGDSSSPEEIGKRVNEWP